MATPAASTFQLGTPITIKVSHDGSNKKVKMPYSDLVADVFEDKLRMALNISPLTVCHFERYSDSGGRFVALNRHNTSVYKQLARAAKAKQKLKLRVVYPEPACAPEGMSVSNTATAASSPGPRPVSIEDVQDVPETKDASPAKAPEVKPIMSPVAVADAPATAQFHHSNPFDVHPSQVPRSIRTYMNDDFFTPVAAQASASPTQTFDGRLACATLTAGPDSPRPAFTVACNRCNDQIPDAHFHCSTCEDGDYDLCLSCVEIGMTCLDVNHWMIRRCVQNGMLVNSTTECIGPKPRTKRIEPSHKPIAISGNPITNLPMRPQPNSLLSAINGAAAKIAQAAPAEPIALVTPIAPAAPVKKFVMSRTCNNCIRESAETDFVHCTKCADFDLCQKCFLGNDHGHSPSHPFVAAVPGTSLSWDVNSLLPAGRGQRHNAICDECEVFITGVRYKCMQCPDWDLCAKCIDYADASHNGHRFVPIYEPLPELPANAKWTNFNAPASALHTGIYCDGPHCTGPNGNYRYIVGDRYKCAVCHNKDFCANCEASPSNKHNKTHPLIKFRTPVRHVSVTTTGEHGNGCQMPVMGDRRNPAAPAKPTVSDLNLNKVQTVLDVKPTGGLAPAPPVVPAMPAQASVKLPALRKRSKDTLAEPLAENLGAMFQRETIPDGTMFPPNFVFEQTWVLRNSGSVAWPAGSRVQFVSGEYMGHVDPTNPAGIRELVSASESTVCYEPLAPGAEFPFTVLLRTPVRPGKVISYWRLTTKGGIKFGDRLWCDVNVREKEKKEEPKPIVKLVEDVKTEKTEKVEKVEKVAEAEKVQEAEKAETAEKAEKAEAKPMQSSQMIFPKLEKESPGASFHEACDASVAPEETEAISEADEFEEWADDSESGFMTDEEYDILDASDEEFLSPPRK